MTALTKAIIAEALCAKQELTKMQAKELIEQFFETVRITLENGEAVKLSGFGNFNLRDKNERPGRNPKTGEEIPVQARRVVTFKAGVKLKKQIEELKENL